MIVVKNVIRDVILTAQSTGTVDAWTDNSGSYTITTDVADLEVGFKVVLIYADTTLNQDVIITSITGTTAFTFSGTSITQPATWEMALYFEVGNRNELNRKYLNKAKSINKMVQEYPLVWLYTNFDQEPSESTGIDFTTDLTFSLVDFTEKNLYEEDRITNKYIPVLYPYLALIKTAFNARPSRDNFIIEYGNKGIDFSTMDFPFFGSQDQKENVLPEITDAIEFGIKLQWRRDKTLC